MFPPSLTHANIKAAPTFIKITEQTFGKIIINTSAITFIDIDAYKVCVYNTDVYGNGMIHLTKESMNKLLSALECDRNKQ